MVTQSEATRSVITLGVSTERGAVHAVALDDSNTQLTDRVVLHRVVQTRGENKNDLAAAVAQAMDMVADELGSPEQIAGAAVAYRDAAERRAMVTRLAAGPWHSASLVSTKSAHLSVAGAMTWLDEFDTLLICEVVPGYQAFTLVDRARSRVLAATGQPAVMPTIAAMSAAVAATRDQLDAAQTRPDAVALIGSAADRPAVMGAVSGFGVPVIPCRIAASAPAVGAAVFAMADLEDPAVPAPPDRSRRGSVALAAAATVLAGGMTAGGVYVLADGQPRSGPIAGHATMTAGTQPEQTGPSAVDPSDAAEELESRPGVPTRFQPDAVTALPEETGQYGKGSNLRESLWTPSPGTGLPLSTGESSDDEPSRDSSSDALERDSVQPAIFPGSQGKLAAPNGLLFPGEAPPPPGVTPESYEWWDEHMRLLLQWVTQQTLPDTE